MPVASIATWVQPFSASHEARSSRPAAGRCDDPGVPVGTVPRRLLHLQGLQAVVADPSGRHTRRPPRSRARRRTDLETAELPLRATTSSGAGAPVPVLLRGTPERATWPVPALATRAMPVCAP